MPHITICERCKHSYEEVSEEAANAPEGRICPTCDKAKAPTIVTDGQVRASYGKATLDAYFAVRSETPEGTGEDVRNCILDLLHRQIEAGHCESTTGAIAAQLEEVLDCMAKELRDRTGCAMYGGEMPEQPYTVILEYPQEIAYEGPETFSDHVMAATPQEAVDKARWAAAKHNESYIEWASTDDEIADVRGVDDETLTESQREAIEECGRRFAPIMVILGHHVDTGLYD